MTEETICSEKPQCSRPFPPPLFFFRTFFFETLLYPAVAHRSGENIFREFITQCAFANPNLTLRPNCAVSRGLRVDPLYPAPANHAAFSTNCAKRVSLSAGMNDVAPCFKITP